MKNLLLRKKTEQDSIALRNKCIALYQALDFLLERTASELELIIPVAQYYDPEFQNAKKKYHKSGFCFGYSQVWQSHILDNYNTEPYVQNLSEYMENGSWPVFPLTEQIATIQKLQSYYPNHSHKYRSAKRFKNTELLLNHLKDYLNKIRFETESIPSSGQYFIINLAPILKPGLHNVFLAAWTRYSPQHLKKWHDVRLYIDPLNRIHWFDSNIGWFRTRQSNPDLGDFCSDLQSIFELLNYSKKYSVIAIHESLIFGAEYLYTNPFQLYIQNPEQDPEQDPEREIISEIKSPSLA